MRIILNNRHRIWQLLLSLVVVASATLWTGCKEDDELLTPGTNKPLAAPKDLSSKVRGTTVTVAWRGNLETKAYEVQLTRVENDSEIMNEEVAKTEFIREELRVRTEYTVRVRALAENPQYSSDWASHTFTTGNENIMRAAAREIRDTAIVVNWLAEQEVTHFVAYPQGTTSSETGKQYSISSYEKLAGEKELGGLEPETTYEVELYNVDYMRGSAEFTTIPRIYPALEVTLSDTTPVSITLSWEAGEPLTHFVLSPASLRGETVLNVEAPANSLVVDSLKPDVSYTISAFKGNSPRGTVSFTTPAPVALTLNAAPEPTTVTLTWTPDSYVTQIAYGSSTYTLTPSDVAAGEVAITPLDPMTEYTFKLQFVIGGATFERGQVTVTTKTPPKPKARYMPANPSALIQDTIPFCLSGDTIVLAAGVTYQWSDTVYRWPNGKSLTIMGASAVSRSTLSVSAGTFMFLPASVDSIVFRQLDIKQVAVADNNYFLNQAAADACNVEKLIFDGCSIYGFGRSVLRLQASAAPSNQRVGIFRINNSVVTNCGNQSGQNYALIQSTAYGLVDNIQFTNSTFSNVSKTQNFITGSNSAQVFQSIFIDGCTFYDVVGTGGRHFIDAGTLTTNNVAVTIQNSILGKVVSTVATNRGTRNCTVTTTNTYQTADWVTTESGIQIDIPNTTPYANGADDLFTDPATGDFHIKDGSFAGAATAGDPRWR